MSENTYVSLDVMSKAIYCYNLQLLLTTCSIANIILHWYISIKYLKEVIDF